MCDYSRRICYNIGMIRQKPGEGILACGAESKGVYAILDRQRLFISKDFGSLDDYKNCSRYEADIEKKLAQLDMRPNIVACDIHPEYNSTIFAQGFNSGARLLKVQHHHAHIASCMRDNNIKGTVIGIAFDGTGYGLDGNIWGGEILLSSLKSFKRAAHLKYLPMPGGDRAVIEPWRMAAVYLRNSFKDKFLKLEIPFIKKINKKNWWTLECMINSKINSPLTSSIGRLFDAVASILFCIYKVHHEAEAAIRLQNCAEKSRESGRYRSKIIKDGELFILDPSDILKAVVRDIECGEDKPVIAAKFHNTIAGTIVDLCRKLRRLYKINKVVLSGGVFQNGLLVKRATELLKESDFSVYTHKRFPASDAGIAIGQAAVAAAGS